MDVLLKENFHYRKKKKDVMEMKVGVLCFDDGG